MNTASLSPDEAAAELRSRAAPIIERAPLPIVEVQGKTHVVSYVNSAFCSLVGKRRGDLIGKPFCEIVPGGDVCIPVLDGVYETGEAATQVWEAESNGNPAYWLYAMWPALDTNERPCGVIIQLTKAPEFRKDVTAVNEALMISGLRQHELRETAEKLNLQLADEIIERQEAQEGLREAQVRLAHANELLADRAVDLESVVAQRTAELRDTVQHLENFSYSIVHDMRAPLR
ncbi:MAG TPA: hypothetical protein VK530_08065, partial [Candidatus Acidoferrum sp.]|nr:hypothetical protein [Candidatus Acidoferrum sp.]